MGGLLFPCFELLRGVFKGFERFPRMVGDLREVCFRGDDEGDSLSLAVSCYIQGAFIHFYNHLPNSTAVEPFVERGTVTAEAGGDCGQAFGVVTPESVFRFH